MKITIIFHLGLVAIAISDVLMTLYLWKDVSVLMVFVLIGWLFFCLHLQQKAEKIKHESSQQD